MQWRWLGEKPSFSQCDDGVRMQGGGGGGVMVLVWGEARLPLPPVDVLHDPVLPLPGHVVLKSTMELAMGPEDGKAASVTRL